MTLSRYPLIVFSNQSESRIQQWLITLVIACTVLLGQGCSAISAPNSPSRSATLIATFATVTPPSVETCLKWYEDIDAAIDTAGIRDGGPHRLAGYPHLRVDRFAASFSAQATQEPKIVPMLLWYARDLDMAARQHELLNLPPRQQEMLGTADTAAAHSILSNCSQLLVRRDIANSASAVCRLACARSLQPVETCSGVVHLNLHTVLQRCGGMAAINGKRVYAGVQWALSNTKSRRFYKVHAFSTNQRTRQY